MTMTRLRLAVSGSIGALAAACASPGAPLNSAFNTGAASVLAPSQSAAPSLSGFQINGATFAGDLIFTDRGGRAMATYRHAVDGADTLIAEMNLDEGWLVDGARLFEGVSDEGVPISVELVSGPCEVNGRQHARFARIEAGRLSYEGCARETGPMVSWTEALPLLLPAVAACEAEASRSSIAFVRRGGGAVIHAREAGGAAVLRYRFGDSGRWECTVRADRARWSILPDHSAPQVGEGFPIFIPGRMPSAGEGCYLYERVESEDGELIGAIGHDACSPGFAATISASFG